PRRSGHLETAIEPLGRGAIELEALGFLEAESVAEDPQRASEVTHAQPHVRRPVVPHVDRPPCAGAGPDGPSETRSGRRSRAAVREHTMQAIPGMEDYPIKLGTLLFTMVEPEKGHEVEYNRWYEHDHFYSGCMVGAWQFAAARFVATRRLKNLRYPAETDMTPDILTGSYLAIYWALDGKHDEWKEGEVAEGNST